MRYFILFSLIFNYYFVIGQDQNIPFKSEESFEVKLDLSFRQRPQGDPQKVNLSETRAEYERRTNISPVPYAKIQVIFKTLTDEEVRVRVIEDRRIQIFNRKAVANDDILIDAGFLEDVRDQIKGYHYEVIFMTQKKEPKSRILIHFDEDGNYFVNEKQRGKI